jgi:hypothetical protein
MKKLKYMAGLIFILTGLNLVGQKSSMIIIKPDPVHVPSSAPVNVVPITGDPIINNDRMVFWVSGLGGDNYSWNDVASYMKNNYEILSKINMDYGTYGLSEAGDHLQEKIQVAANSEANPDPSKNFIIAHSQGGLVSRAAYQNFAADGVNYGGIVTFGTPHQGALLLNNVPWFIDYIDDSCNALTSGPGLEAWYGNWFLSFIDSDVMLDKINFVCQFISNDIVPFMAQDYLASITNDYKFGAPYIAQLNEFDENMINEPEINIPKVAYFGEEEAPVIWRVAYSLLNDVNIEEPFQANDDSEIIGIANENQNRYYMKYMAYKTLYDITSNSCLDYYEIWEIIALPWLCYAVNLNATFNENGDLIAGISWFPYNKDEVAEVRDAYSDGYYWWTGVENSYLTFIGAVENVFDHCECRCTKEIYDNANESAESFIEIIDCNDNCNQFEDTQWNDNTGFWITCNYATVYEKHIKPNDGIVLVESAQDYPGADNGNDNKMDKTNHIQMRNNSELKLKLISLTDGDDGLFFETD